MPKGKPRVLYHHNTTLKQRLSKRRTHDRGIIVHESFGFGLSTGRASTTKRAGLILRVKHRSNFHDMRYMGKNAEKVLREFGLINSKDLKRQAVTIHFAEGSPIGISKIK